MAHFLLREPKGRVGRRSIGIIIDAAAVIGHSPLLDFSTLFFGGTIFSQFNQGAQVGVVQEMHWDDTSSCCLLLHWTQSAGVA